MPIWMTWLCLRNTAANCKTDQPVLGLIAHMDTSPQQAVKMCKHVLWKNYNGGDILLNAEKKIVMRPTEFESLLDYRRTGSDCDRWYDAAGSDDKARVAEIFTALERLTTEKNIPARYD